MQCNVVPASQDLDRILQETMDDMPKTTREPNQEMSGKLNIMKEWGEYLKVNDSDKEWLITIRHGERLDFKDENWFDRWSKVKKMSEEKRKKKGLDYFPSSFPERENFKDFLEDVPLTFPGEEQARKLGRKMRKGGIKIKAVYASPAYRCIQTAKCLSEGLGYEGLINIENGLVEILTTNSLLFGCSQRYIPVMKKEELEKEGIKIDANYVPLFNEVEDVDLKETMNDYRERLFKVYRHCRIDANVRVAPGDNGAILIVAHRSTAGTVTWKMRQPNKITKVGFIVRHLKPEFLHHEIACLDHNKGVILRAYDQFTRQGKTKQFKMFDPEVCRLNLEEINEPEIAMGPIIDSSGRNTHKEKDRVTSNLKEN